MKMGFTGTQEGMTAFQKEQVLRLLKEYNPTEAHIGDCIGADTDFYEIVRSNFAKVALIGHPPNNDSKRSFLTYSSSRSPKPYLVRNWAIVDETEMLLATPKGAEIQRSGTWATIRYAEKIGKPVVIVYPNNRIDIVNKDGGFSYNPNTRIRITPT